MTRACEDVVDVADLGGATGVHDVHGGPANARDHAEVVRDEDHRRAGAFLDALQQLEDCAWIVTSRAVVGSSAMITSGSLAIIIAIMARWRMPPENSCGYCVARTSGRGMPTDSSRSNGLAHRVLLGDVPVVRADRFGELLADAQHRVQPR